MKTIQKQRRVLRPFAMKKIKMLLGLLCIGAPIHVHALHPCEPVFESRETGFLSQLVHNERIYIDLQITQSHMHPYGFLSAYYIPPGSKIWTTQKLTNGPILRAEVYDESTVIVWKRNRLSIYRLISRNGNAPEFKESVGVEINLFEKDIVAFEVSPSLQHLAVLFESDKKSPRKKRQREGQEVERVTTTVVYPIREGDEFPSPRVQESRKLIQATDIKKFEVDDEGKLHIVLWSGERLF